MLRLPLPAKDGCSSSTTASRKGVFSINRARLPVLAIVTVLIWATEAMRLLLVIEALNFRDVHLGISGAFFVALIASLLTADPVHAGRPWHRRARRRGILTVIYGVDPTNAAAITLVDRAISVLSIIGLGSIAYLVSSQDQSAAVASQSRLSPRFSGRLNQRVGPNQTNAVGAPAFNQRGRRRDQFLLGIRPASAGAVSVQVRARHLAVLAGGGESAHAQGQVVLHHLAHLRLAQQIV